MTKQKNQLSNPHPFIKKTIDFLDLWFLEKKE